MSFSQINFKNPITEQELEALLKDRLTRKAAFEYYFEYDMRFPFSKECQLKKGIEIVQDISDKSSENLIEDFAQEGLITAAIGDTAINLANNYSKDERDERYEKLKHTAPIKIVSEGDSWFQYPRYKIFGIPVAKGVKDIIDHLLDNPNYAIKSLDAGGDLLRNMYHQREYIKAIANEEPDIFLLSAGGNDFFDVFPGMLKERTTDADIAELLGDNLDTEIAVLGTYYRALLQELIMQFPKLHIIVHGYDYVLPRAKGKWLGKPMIDKGITDPQEQRNLIKVIMDKFNDNLESIAAETIFNNRVHYLNLRGMVPSDLNFWHDEIHPNDEGFSPIGEKFSQKIDEIMN